MEDVNIDEIDATGLPTLEKKEIFLSVLAASCNVTKAAKISKLNRQDLYKWRAADELFAQRWEEARELGVEALEDEMHRRAVDGVLKINKNGAYREYSDTLAIFLAKAHKPDRYSERVRNEISGPGGEPLNMEDAQIAMKLDSILKAAQARRVESEAEPEDQNDDEDFDDLC